MKNLTIQAETLAQLIGELPEPTMTIPVVALELHNILTALAERKEPETPQHVLNAHEFAISKNVQDLRERLDRYRNRETHLQEIIEQYQKFGTPESVEWQNKYVQANGILEQYQKLGTPEEIDHFRNTCEHQHEQLQREAIEWMHKFAQANTLLEQYQKLGTPEEIEAACADRIEWMNKCDQAHARLEQYQKLGTPEEIQTVFDKIKEETSPKNWGFRAATTEELQHFPKPTNSKESLP